MKKKKDLMKVTAFSLTPKQISNLRDLSEYSGKNISEVVRALIPGREEIEAWKAYQDFDDDFSGNKNRKRILNKIAKTRRLFMELVMSNHCQFPIGLQVKATSYLDRRKKNKNTGVFKLFKNWISALRLKKGYRFVTDKHKFPGSQARIYFYVLAPGESKKDVDQLIGKYATIAPNAEVLNAIQQNARVKIPKTKTKKK